MTKLIFFAVVLLFGWFAVAQADFQRGLQNYLDILNGKKTVQQLSPVELKEVLSIHQRLQSTGGAAFTSGSYQIQASANDEWFIINGEKYQAQTYCFDFDKGDLVKFLEGSPLGACATAKILNLRNNRICEVWCE